MLYVCVAVASVVGFLFGVAFRSRLIREMDELLDRKKAALDARDAAWEGRRESLDRLQAALAKEQAALSAAYAAFAERREQMDAAEHLLDKRCSELTAAIAQHNEAVARFKRMFTRTQRTYSN